MKQFLLALTLFSGLSVWGQDTAKKSTKKDIPQNWHLLSPSTDGYYGIDMAKAYDFVKGKKSTTIVVGVIDSGIDTTHEDLKPVLWRNKKEIPGNGIDDDKNGYVDDIYGWNFLGGKDGKNVKEDSYEGARVYYRFKSKFENLQSDQGLNEEDKKTFAMWKKAKGYVVDGAKEDAERLPFLKTVLKNASKSDSILSACFKRNYTLAEAKEYVPANDTCKKARSYIVNAISRMGDMKDDSKPSDFIGELKDYVDGQQRKVDAATIAPPNYRADIVKDDETNINDRFYGNSDVMASTPLHGTHVSGIIAAARNNTVGIDGVADNVKILTVRAVPDGDEHDKDIALAIRYAVDNGAKIINMSFGKSFSPDKKWVDEAVKYAASKGVLLVHAAGNDTQDVDTEDNFPCAAFAAGGRATNWITVGANGPEKEALAASFSNYGKKEVDVFAPGVNIYSTMPGGNKYGNESGTSMASPVVAGLAAFILSYYPQLKPDQLKEIIMKSVTPGGDAKVKRTDEEGKTNEINFSDLSVTGGVVNAYEAVKLADEYIKKTKSQKMVPKATLKKAKKG